MTDSTHITTSSVVARIALLLSLTFIFGDAYGTYRLGGSFRYITYAILAFSVVTGLWKWSGAKKNMPIGMPLAMTAVFFFLVSFSFWTSLYNSNAYIGIVIASILFYLDRKSLNTFLLFLLVFNFSLGLYEFLTKSYLFSNEMLKNGAWVVYDMKTAGGAAGVLRVKALFYGSLSFGLFALGVAFFFSRRILILLLCLLSAVIAGTRLAIIMTLILIFINPSLKMRYRIFFLLAFLFLTIIGMNLLNSYDLATYERIMTVFDMDSGTHDNRLLMWETGLEQFASYDILHMFTGDNGLFFSLYTNNSESGWITLLTDTGLLGFLLYLIPLVNLLVVFLARKWYYMAAVVFLFFIANTTVTFNLSSTGNLMYWFCMFRFAELMNVSKASEKENTSCQDIADEGTHLQYIQ